MFKTCFGCRCFLVYYIFKVMLCCIRLVTAYSAFVPVICFVRFPLLTIGMDMRNNFTLRVFAYSACSVFCRCFFINYPFAKLMLCRVSLFSANGAFMPVVCFVRIPVITIAVFMRLGFFFCVSTYSAFSVLLSCFFIGFPFAKLMLCCISLFSANSAFMPVVCFVRLPFITIGMSMDNIYNFYIKQFSADSTLLYFCT